MVDHRRTPSQRAYRLPGWFFLLTGVLSLAGVGLAAVVLVDNPFGARGHAGATAAPSPTIVRTSPPTPRPSPSHKQKDQARDGLEVVVLNATTKDGLARGVAERVKDAGWTVAEVGNWPYPAAQNAVFYPEGHRSEGELLGEDLSIASVRPARPGMSADQLTVILLNVP
ncbi:MAG TPA: LytR C-terminal domain-containing protein [Aeromicrobium sp.]|nr:LytR C-terminal domain-containing protein [Aeromicrobium sp.]